MGGNSLTKLFCQSLAACSGHFNLLIFLGDYDVRVLLIQVYVMLYRKLGIAKKLECHSFIRQILLQLDLLLVEPNILAQDLWRSNQSVNYLFSLRNSNSNEPAL